ncbi:hypothetical protein [Clostridium sp. C105KSO13]|uniref:hypothetical protein n=1 Tax=Clostridium sp. C105KSO13 TaxID=1776045 RepID=UPI0007406B0A|nr:hypothetical protein [Clostridium sp. C105KSO13]CUX33223.1 hypothetical protein BN3456_01474 [Clostridium sp. C105KSO13]
MKIVRGKYRIWCVALFFVMLIFLLKFSEKPKNVNKEMLGVPDAVSSTSTNQDHHLTVVANSDTIPDKEAFARKVIHMCQDNAFHSIMFSTDVNGYPRRLEINVYLWEDDIREKEPVCHIRYAPLEYNDEYDIKNDQEQFHLYLDDKEIEFY